MATPFIGEIRMFGGNYAPSGWAFCQGQLLPISEYDALFSLIGTTYGGDGQNTFALPNLQSRIPIHQGGSYPLGEMNGQEEVTLSAAQIPLHTHGLQATTTAANSTSPAGNLPAAAEVPTYAPPSATPAPIPTSMLASAISGGNSGGQSHNNLMPFQCVSFIISLFGIYPSQS
jgi:microcystin-dependent protein